MSIIVNWAHVREIMQWKGTADVLVEYAMKPNKPNLIPAKDILVVGDGDMRVNAWLKEVASENKEESDE